MTNASHTSACQVVRRKLPSSFTGSGTSTAFASTRAAASVRAAAVRQAAKRILHCCLYCVLWTADPLRQCGRHQQSWRSPARADDVRHHSRQRTSIDH